MFYTTLNLLEENNPCSSGWKTLIASLPKRYKKDKPISFTYIIESNGLRDAIWALRAVPEEQKELVKKIARLFSADCAERVLPLFEAKYPEDTRPRNAIKVARDYANGLATDQERRAAYAAAAAAFDDAFDDAAYAAAAAAFDDAFDAAAYAAYAAAFDDAFDAAAYAAYAAAAKEKERSWQEKRFLQLLEEYSSEPVLVGASND